MAENKEIDLENPDLVDEDEDDIDGGMTEIVDFVDDAVKQIWNKYDRDNN